MGLIYLPCILVAVGLFVLCFFHPALASRTFVVVFIVGLEGFCVISLLFQRKVAIISRLATELTSDELDLFNAYKLHFLFPGLTRELSSVVAMIGLASYGFVALLLWKGHYVEAGIIGINCVLAGPLSHKLSPFNGLKGMAERGNEIALRRFDAWDGTWKKIVEFLRRVDQERQVGH